MTYEELFVDAYLEHKNKAFLIKKIADNGFLVVDENDTEMQIGFDDWLPLDLSEEWLRKFGLSVNCIIVCRRNNREWAIRKSGNIFYATINHHSYQVTGVCWPLHYVHDLQDLYYLLTWQTLKCFPHSVDRSARSN